MLAAWSPFTDLNQEMLGPKGLVGWIILVTIVMWVCGAAYWIWRKVVPAKPARKPARKPTTYAEARKNDEERDMQRVLSGEKTLGEINAWRKRLGKEPLRMPLVGDAPQQDPD